MKRRTQVISGSATNISFLLDGSNIFKDSVDDVVIVIHYIFQKVNIAEKSLEPRYYIHSIQTVAQTATNIPSTAGKI